MKPDDHNYDAWEHYKEVLHEGLKELLSENLSIDVSITKESYTEGTYNVRVSIAYDGDEVTSMTDTIYVPDDCQCGGYNG